MLSFAHAAVCLLVLLAGCITASLCVVAASSSPPPARAKDILQEAGFSDREIASVLDGKLHKRVLDSTHDREIAMAFAVLVPDTPEELCDVFISQRFKQKVDPAVTAIGIISGVDGSIEDFSKVSLEHTGHAAAANDLINASPNDDYNLSREEIAAFNKLNKGDDDNIAKVENTLRELLLDRYRSYKRKGLAGILPYARDKNKKDYNPGNDMNLSSKMTTILKREAPVFFNHLVHFPVHRPLDLQESYSYVLFDVDGRPNVELIHRMGRKQESGSFVFSERQYYALNSYNCVHGEGGAIPCEDGTLLIFSSRTSTDSVAGFGGMAKRALGVRMMGNMVADILERYQQLKEERDGGDDEL